MEGSTQPHIEPRPPLRVQLTEEGPARPFVHVGLGTAVESLSECPKGNIVPGDANAPTGSNFPDRNDWAPRFGFAWSPGTSGKMTIRGGFGVFYDILKAEDNLQFNGQAPFFAFADLQSFSPITTNPTAEITNMTKPFVAASQSNPFPSTPPSKNLDFA